MKYYLIAGEASGDLHASHLMKELKRQDSDAQFRFFGGDMMATVGVYGFYSRLAASAYHSEEYAHVQAGYHGVET